MKFTRMLSALFIAASLVLGMHSAASADQLQDIKARGTLRVAIPQDYPPFGFMGPDKQIKGYDIEMAGIVAKALGVKCELVPVTGANRIPFLLSNRADIVISTLGKTKERQKVIDFSIAYAATYSGVFGPEKINVTKPEDLKGHTISVTRGCIEDQLISKVLPQGAVLKRYEDNNTTSQAYLSGQTDFICTLNFVAGALKGRMKNDRAPVSKFSLRNSPDFIGLRQNDPALRDAVNKAITAAFQDGTLDALSQKYLGSPAPKDLITQEPGE